MVWRAFATDTDTVGTIEACAKVSRAGPVIAMSAEAHEHCQERCMPTLGAHAHTEVLLSLIEPAVAGKYGELDFPWQKLCVTSHGEPDQSERAAGSACRVTKNFFF